MSSGGAWAECLRISRASAASSFFCHSEEADTEARSESARACEGKGGRDWEPEGNPRLRASRGECPFGPQSRGRLPPARGALLVPFAEPGPCRGSGPRYFPGGCGCGRRGSREATQGRRTRPEHPETGRAEAGGPDPPGDTCDQQTGAARNLRALHVGVRMPADRRRPWPGRVPSPARPAFFAISLPCVLPETLTPAGFF